ncbi:uncharacterized protein LOC113349916 isoform X3 [Papaver somniferum]|uniref:uncharacterized protein LOC113349916 isoform X3 n=1 Tax=Papaver somniferum TaxID=3469 RepID=UPI000E6F52FC|nr:uncharacterized protein LOC113349916 isoform X3 [Papaver somniferum]XP_026449748.1 uncharacterized protein LOC113349916 isoform X3 [Papaver somniferum]
MLITRSHGSIRKLSVTGLLGANAPSDKADTYGPWMLVTKKSQKGNIKAGTQASGQISQAARYGNMKGIRGVIRDESGSFVVCYGKHIFKNNNNVAEVWAIRDGLRLAVHLGIHNFEVEGDSCYVVQLCKEEGQPQWDTYGLVKKISELMACFNQVNFTQRYREANNIVDRLAKDGASRKHEGTWIGVLPDFFVV